MRYVAETMFKADLIDLQRIFHLNQIEVIDDDVFSFDCDDDNTHIISDLIDNPAILRVYTESSYLKLNKNASLSQSSSAFKLLWYGHCNNFELEHGDTLDLTQHKDTLQEVWKRNDDSDNFVSWNSKMHPSVIQPFSSIKEGNLFFVKLDKNTTLQIKGLEDVESILGLSSCDYPSISSSNELKNEYNLIWYGKCGNDENQIVNLSLIPNILEVYQFSEKGNYINGVYYANDSSKSTISKLKYGNGYFVKLKKNTTQKIEGSVVSDHATLSTLAPSHPLRLKDCTSVGETPTPMETPTPFNYVCCADDDVKMEISSQVNETKNYITAKGQNGTLCWEQIEEAGKPSFHICWLETIGDLSKSILITSSGDISNLVIRFISDSNVCYETKLTSEKENIFRRLGEVDALSPTPVPQPTPVSEEATPTPKQIVTCCESDSGITITKGMEDTTNPTGPNGVTISGFEEGGILCVGTLTNEADTMSCAFETEDKSIGGIITLSFKLVDSNIKYKATDGKCYTGTIQNSITEPQILTEV